MNTYVAIISGKDVELVPAIDINDCAFLLYYSCIEQMQSYPQLLGSKVKVWLATLKLHEFPFS
jgi:hypothetical protein